MNYSAIKVKNLSACAINVTLQDYYRSEWEIPFEQTEAEREDGVWDPMTNDRYELPCFKMPDNVKELLDKAGSVTLVYFPEEETYYLALNGGGMDLSWDICRAYMLLGYLPPLSCCELPRLAGMNYRRVRNAKVLQACKYSVEVSTSYARRVKEKLRALTRG